MERLSPLSVQGVSFNVVDQAKFAQAIQLLKESLFDGGGDIILLGQFNLME